jgi:flagellar L-ring protein precursor FlgH
VWLVLAGCADIPYVTPTPPPLPTPPPPLDEPYQPAEGSLWHGETSRRFLAFENRAKRIGDLVTVLILEQAEAEKEASTELERTSEIEARIDSGVSLQTVIERPILSVLSLLGFTNQRSDKSPTEELTVADAETKTKFEGEGTVKREATFTTTIACVVTDRMPSGLLRIDGERQLRINNETQVIRLSGWVRPEDIRINNTIPSTLIASADIRYNGVGLITEKQRAPWMLRLLELVLPF